MKHLDLFSGIGGFALAVDTVWPNSEHIFCDNDKFCQQVLKKHWPNSPIYGDIRTLTNTEHNGIIRTEKIGEHSETQPEGSSGQELFVNESSGNDSLWEKETGWDILTGGFPCQPFSQAGRRKGTEDDRYLWPEMLRVIQLTHPRWVIAENVRGLLTWNEGLVLEQVCLDLEGEGYEVQPFIIPAVAVNAPHRRDRLWFIAKSNSRRLEGSEKERWYGQYAIRENSYVKNSIVQRSGRRMESDRQVLESGRTEIKNERPNWETNWLEVATAFCGVDDGLSVELDGLKLSNPQHRVQRLKSLGNAIVPQVAIEIMRAIKATI